MDSVNITTMIFTLINLVAIISIIYFATKGIKALKRCINKINNFEK